MGWPEFKAPEVATVVRWILRAVLVCFLAWLVKGRSQQEEEEEQPEEEADASYRRNGNGGVKPRGQRGGGNNINSRYARQTGRDPYAQQAVRQRRPMTSESTDFDAVISKMSKPKDMWEVRKTDTGEAPQIHKRHSSGDVGESVTKVPSSKEIGRPEISQPSQRKENKQEDANSLLKKTMLHGHTRPVTFITWNRDCNLLFTSAKDKQVCVWSFPDGECLGSYVGHQGAVWACSVTSDSSWLVTSGADRLVIVWEARTSRELARMELPGVARFVEWASAGTQDDTSRTERFVTAHNKFGSHPPALTVWQFDGTNIEEQMRVSTLPTPATQVRWGKDDLVLASSHENGELIFWQAADGAEVRRIKAHDALLSKFDFSADRELVATVSTDMKVKVWDLGQGSEGTLLYHIETDRPLNTVALGPLTRAVAVGAPSGRPGVCTVIAAGGQDIRDVALSKGTSDEFDSKMFRLGMDDAFPSELQADGAAKGHFGPVHTLAFTVDGSAMASGSEDGCIRLHLFDPSILAAKEASQ
jgi:translation initiation factor 3 subunit I